MEPNNNIRPGNQLDGSQHNQRLSSLLPAHLRPVRLVSTRFPIPLIVVPQHIAQNPLDPRLLDETKSSQFRGMISDRGDSVALQRQYYTQRRKYHELPQGPAHDPNEDFPTNDSARQKMLVGQIFQAIRNKAGLLDVRPVRDDQGQPVFDGNGNILKKPDTNTKRVDEMTDIKVEMLSWDILYGIKDAHEGSLHGTERTWAHSFHYERHETFLQRFEKVVDLLQVSKRAVCDLLEASRLCRITNAPCWELGQKRRIKDWNEKKGDVYKEGKRKRLQSQASISVDDDGAEKGDHGIRVGGFHESGPNKRQCLSLASPDELSSASIEAQQIPGTAQHTFISTQRPEPSGLPYQETRPPTTPSTN